MSFIGRFFCLLFGVVSFFMLFIMLFRLANDNGAYIGLSDIYYYFENHPLDVFNSFQDMFDNITSTLNDFKNSFIETSPFTLIWEDGFKWYETFLIVWEGFKYTFNIMFQLTRIIFLPITTIYYVLQYIVGIIYYFILFITFLIN